MGEIGRIPIHRSSASTGEEVASSAMQHLLDSGQAHNRGTCVQTGARSIPRGKASCHFILTGDSSNVRVLPGDPDPQLVVDNNRPSPFEHRQLAFDWLCAATRTGEPSFH